MAVGYRALGLRESAKGDTFGGHRHEEVMEAVALSELVKSEALCAVMLDSLPLVLTIDRQEAFTPVRVLFNWRCGVEKVIASVQHMLTMPGIVLSVRYTKMNKTKFFPLIN